MILNLDGDEAGLKAMQKSCLDIFVPLESALDPRIASYDIRIATFPPGLKDADDFLKVRDDEVLGVDFSFNCLVPIGDFAWQ